MVKTLTLLHQSLCSWHLLFFGSCSCKGISCLSERKSRMFRMDSGIPLHRAACHHTANRWGNDSTLDGNDCLLSPYRRENSLKVEMVRHLYPVVQNTDNTVHIRVNYYLENGVFCPVHLSTGYWFIRWGDSPLTTGPCLDHNNTHEEILTGCEQCSSSVTPVQITHLNSGLWLAETQWEIF